MPGKPTAVDEIVAACNNAGVTVMHVIVDGGVVVQLGPEREPTRLAPLQERFFSTPLGGRHTLLRPFNESQPSTHIERAGAALHRALVERVDPFATDPVEDEAWRIVEHG